MGNRFPIMALLQESRARALGYPLEFSESFGLNRAIFYAMCKSRMNNGVKRMGGVSKKIKTQEEKEREAQKEDKPLIFVGRDKVYIDREETAEGIKIMCKMGDEIQTSDKFIREIRKLGNTDELLILGERVMLRIKDENNLIDGNRFFNNVYRPLRDMQPKDWLSFLGDV